LTTSSTIDILLTGSTALYIGWQRDDRNTCDGFTRDDRQVCICPADHELRRATARQGRGCRPCAKVLFRLLDDQAVGVLEFVNDDWSFVELVSATQAVLSSREGKGLVGAQLGLRRSLHTLPSGMVLPYTRPVITLLGDHRWSSSVSAVISA
jgi:hypothetical protein